MKKTKIAVIGYGGMGGWHTRHLLASDVAELAGIYDIKEERRALAVENGIRAYSSLEDIGVSSKKIDTLLEYSPLVRNRLTFMRLRRMSL